MPTRTKSTTASSTPTPSGFLEKVVLNVGLGRASQSVGFEDKQLKQVMADIAAITGQQPRVTRAKKSIASFKLRERQIIGVALTLRGKKMVDFFERFTRIVLPRVRDFSGIPEAKLDAGGTLNVGIREHLVFPEINPEASLFIFPLQIGFVPRIRHRETAVATFRALGMPFAKPQKIKA